MSECVAVTRGGWGDVWLFSSREEADTHPLVQYGDAILGEPLDIPRQYNLLELPRFMAMLGDEDLRVEVLASVHPDLNLSIVERQKRVEEKVDKIWSALLQISNSAPEDPEIICELIRSDRVQTKETAMADKAPKTPKEKAPAVSKERKSLFADDAVITMGADKDGKKYDGKTNNPKRAGTKAHEQFAKFKDGMTVTAFRKAIGADGAADAELKWCAGKGWINIAGYKAPVAEKKAA